MHNSHKSMENLEKTWHDNDGKLLSVNCFKIQPTDNLYKKESMTCMYYFCTSNYMVCGAIMD